MGTDHEAACGRLRSNGHQIDLVTNIGAVEGAEFISSRSSGVAFL